MFVQLTILSLSFDKGSSGYGIINPTGPIFLTTFILSILSATLGLTKFLKNGPCQLVPHDFYGCGFISVMLIMFFSLLWKGGHFFLFLLSRQDDSNLTNSILIWICCFVIPHIIYVCILSHIIQCLSKNNSDFWPFMK